MEYSKNPTTATTTFAVTEASRLSRTSSDSSQPSVIMSPCAACKILRRRCVEKCILAPYFPPTEPLKFTTAHRLFGASNIVKLLQEIPETQREDAVNSMVYEANARLRDPVYGCTGVICQLQNQINELQAELAKAKAQNLNMQCERIWKQLNDNEANLSQIMEFNDHNSTFVFDESNLDVAWEPLWTWS